MRVTTQGEYGLRCVLNIAKGNGKPVTIEKICRKEGISCDYAEQLLMRLRRAGIVESQRGPGGGYVLAAKPARIKVREVVLALENNPFEVICRKFMKKNMKCGNSSNCKIKHLWQRLSRQAEDILTEVSIADLI